MRLSEHQFWFMSRVLAADSAITTHSIFYDSVRLFLGFYFLVKIECNYWIKDSRSFIFPEAV